MSTLPYPFPQSEFIPWTPDADGATLAVPAPANSLTSYPSLRVQNITRGTLYISNNIGSVPSESVFDYRIGPYSSETITPNAQGVQVLWRGVAGSGESVGFSWSAVASAPGGASVGEPYFPTSQTCAWYPDDVAGIYVTVGQFLEPGASLSAWQITPPLGNRGQTIVAMQIENRTGYTLTVFKDDAFGELLGVIEPFRATTLQVGTNQIYVIRDFGTHWSGGNEQVRFYAYDSIPKLDPAAMYELPGIHEPAGSGLQVTISSANTAPATLLNIPPGKTFVLNRAEMEVHQIGAALGVVDGYLLNASQGIDGQGGADSLVGANAVGQGAGIVKVSGPCTCDGPIMIVSRPAPFAPNSITVTRAFTSVTTLYTVNLSGWYLP